MFIFWFYRRALDLTSRRACPGGMNPPTRRVLAERCGCPRKPRALLLEDGFGQLRRVEPDLEAPVAVLEALDTHVIEGVGPSRQLLQRLENDLASLGSTILRPLALDELQAVREQGADADVGNRGR